MATTEVIMTGPLFDGRMQSQANAAVAEATYKIAQQVSADVHWVLDRDIKHPTPYYETQINIRPVAQDLSVNDRGVIYGPWLEGTSSRNQTTRFKGYAAFRRAFAEAKEYAQLMTNKIVSKYLGGMGG